MTTDTWIPTPTSLGQRLRAVRNHLGLNQEEFSRPLNVAASTYATWERGAKPRDVGEIELCRRVADVYHVDERWLQTGELPGQGQNQNWKFLNLRAKTVTFGQSELVPA